MQKRVETEPVEDLWREVQAIGNEGAARACQIAEDRLNDVIELMAFHDREAAAGELRRTTARLREERDTFADRAGALRALVADRK
jgi:hypothetical protein